jgi:hypothetical protein
MLRFGTVVVAGAAAFCTLGLVITAAIPKPAQERIALP